MLSVKKIIKISIASSLLFPTLSVFSSCSISSSYRADGTNWQGLVKGHFDRKDYEINDTNKTITYNNGNKIMSTNLIVPDYVDINGSFYKVLLGKKCFFNNTLLSKDIRLNKFITSIPDECFSGCIALQSITIKSVIKSIGKDAFYDCISLKTINADNGFFYFLESIGERAFYRCQLKNAELVFGSSLVNLEPYAFYGCWGVKNISFNDASKISTIPTSCFAGCNSTPYVSLGKTINKISDDAFLSCLELKNVILSDDMELSLGNDVFHGCSKLIGFTEKCKFTSIGSGCFSSCFSLTNINDIISNSGTDALNEIKSNTFNSCNLTYLKIPSNIKKIYDFAFANCDKLANIDVSDFNTKEKTLSFFGRAIFSSNIISGNVFYSIDTDLNYWKNTFSDAGLNVNPGGWNFIPVV